jgi:hypothetical protein
MIFKGQVVKLSSKSGTGKRGPWTAYSAKVQGLDGKEYEPWISLGFTKPEFTEGDFVEITTEEKDGRQQFKSFTKFTPAPAATGSGSTGPSTGYIPKDTLIQYQAARNSALALVELLLKADALPISQAKTKSGESKRYDEIVGIVNKLTVQFHNDTHTLRLLETVADAGALEEPPEGYTDDATSTAAAEDD